MTAEEMRIEIGKRIKNRRLELEMTQEELARRAGFKNKASIAKIESGVQGVSYDKAQPIADALGVSPGHIMGW